MRKKIISFLTGIALAAGVISASAASVSVATVPAGMISYNLPHGTTTLLSLPLTNTATYTSTVSAVSSNSITVSDAPAPFTKNLATGSAPYFVKFISGTETGRIMLITANTTSSLSLDINDHSTGSPLPINSPGFDVRSGDAFEIFPADTLASVFGANTAQNPLIVSGGAGPIGSDLISLFTSANDAADCYFFNTTVGYWEQLGSTGNANNTIIYPYSAFAVNRHFSLVDKRLIVTGRVAGVTAQTKLVSNGTIYTSTHFATDVKLSQLQFGSNWVMGASALTADMLSVWNAGTSSFDTYYQKPDTTWRRFPDAVTDQSNVTIAAGAVTTIAKRGAVAGGAMFLASQLPYSLN